MELTPIANEPAVRDFVADAWAHKKFIGHHGLVESCFELSGVSSWQDDAGVLMIGSKRQHAFDFLVLCKAMRHWEH